jgi:hypothetical protein
MLLYHASNRVIASPAILNRHGQLDFGTGFYTTPNEEQAQNFAHKVLWHLSPVLLARLYNEELETGSFEAPKEQ